MLRTKVCPRRGARSRSLWPIPEGCSLGGASHAAQSPKGGRAAQPQRHHHCAARSQGPCPPGLLPGPDSHAATPQARPPASSHRAGCVADSSQVCLLRGNELNALRCLPPHVLSGAFDTDTLTECVLVLGAQLGTGYQGPQVRTVPVPPGLTVQRGDGSAKRACPANEICTTGRERKGPRAFSQVRAAFLEEATSWQVLGGSRG